MSLKFNRTFAASILGAVLAAGLGWGLLNWGFGWALRAKSHEWLLVARGEQPATDAAIVYMDEVSFDKLKQPMNAPWDRTLHARLIDRLTAAGARAIVFDIVFTDPDKANSSADQTFAKAMKASGRVILAADNVRIGPKQTQMQRPFDLLLDAAAGMGSTEVLPDRDLVVRIHTPEEPLPSLAWVAAEFVGAKATKEPIQPARRWMNYYGSANFLPSRSYYEALDPALVADDFFRGKVVFVGARVNTRFPGERKDEYRTPFGTFGSSRMAEERQGSFIAGAEVQATAFLNLLRGDWLSQWSPATENAIVLAVGLVFGFGLVQLRPAIASLVAVVALTAATVVFHALFRRSLIWFPWLIVIGQIGVAFLWSVTFNSIQLYVQKRLFEYTLGLYLTPKLVKKFSRDPKFLKPGAEEQTISILFTDIADFTTLSQSMTSDALAKLMNEYFELAVSRCIHKTDGTVVKYIGDAVFAFWNAPDPQTDHEYRACEAALRLRDLSKEPIQGRLLPTRLGIHTGPAHIGNFGSAKRVDYTALGESVNLASRLEGLNKYLSTDCLISAETKKGLGDRLLTRCLGEFQLKGFESAVEVHEIVGWPDEAKATLAWREAFAQALENYQQRNLEFAAIGFRRALELKPEDGPSKFYLARIEELSAQDLPGEWATHTILREK
jgi:adenylate cyclase